MLFSDIPGQTIAKKLLLNDFQNNTIAHSYLFIGEKGTGKWQMATAFAQILNCENPKNNESCNICNSCKKISKLIHQDIIYIYPSNSKTDRNSITQELTSNKFKSITFPVSAKITIDTIRNIVKKTNMGINEGKYKVIIMLNAERMNKEAANAFLKTLEEPPERTIFILTSENETLLLDTIKSRCRKISFYPLKKNDFIQFLKENEFAPNTDKDLLYFLSKGSIGKLFTIIDKEIEQFNDFANNVINTINSSDLLQIYETTQKFTEQKDEDKLLIIEILKYKLKALFLKDSNNLIFSTVELQEIITFLDKIEYAIRRNYNLSLIFENFLINIKNVKKLNELFETT